MEIQEISQLLEKRRNDLISLLENQEAGLKLEKQHQIYGAINEIEIFMQTLTYLRDRELSEDMKDVELAKPADNDNLVRRVFGNFKGIFKNRQ